MEEDEKRLVDMVTRHDKIIDSLATAVEHLASSTELTNAKLDRVVDALTTQNVLIERMNNLDINLKETFGRIYKKIEDIEKTHNGEGCPALRLNVQKDKELEDRVIVLEDIFKWLNRIILTAIIASLLGTILI